MIIEIALWLLLVSFLLSCVCHLLSALVLTSAAVQALLAAVAVTNPTAIRLSNKSFDLAAAEKVAAYLAFLESVDTADISDIIAGRPEEEALKVVAAISASLQKFPLVSLDVSDNAFGAKGVEACRPILSGKLLQVRLTGQF